MKPKRKTSNHRAVGALRLLLRVLGALFAVLVVSLFVSLAIWPPINDVETGMTAEYPGLQPRAYRFSAERVFSAAEEAIEALDRFHLTSTEIETGTVEATANTRSGHFTDDVTVRVEPNGDGGAIVFIRSASRVGRGDFGQNARNIEALQLEMDQNLGAE